MAIARWSGVLTGMLGIGMALVLATWNIASLWDQFNTFLGLLTSGLGALFIMGIFFRKISGVAALAGVITGITLLTLIRSHTTMSFLLYGFTGMMLSVSTAWILSLIFPNKKNIAGFTWKNRASA
jgi:solute:Na+ symporter, SSS family